MPVRSEDRATVNLGKDLILAARERAEEEGTEFSVVVTRALRQYLRAPARRPDGELPGLAAAGPDEELHIAVQSMMAEFRKLLPQVAAIVDDHAEVMDALDQVTVEIGRRNGAALALEQIQKSVGALIKPKGT